MSSQEPPEIEPVADDGVRITTLGTLLWALAGVLCLLLRDQLAAHDNEWWIATCAVGTLLGLAAMTYTRRRAAVYRAAQRPSAPIHGGSDPR